MTECAVILQDLRRIAFLIIFTGYHTGGIGFGVQNPKFKICGSKLNKATIFRKDDKIMFFYSLKGKGGGEVRIS